MTCSSDRTIIFISDPGTKRDGGVPVNGYQLRGDDGQPLKHLFLHFSVRFQGRWAVTDTSTGETICDKWQTQKGALAKAAEVYGVPKGRQ